jgi:hypothetical protein
MKKRHFHREGAKKRKGRNRIEFLRVSSRLGGGKSLVLVFFHNS